MSADSFLSCCGQKTKVILTRGATRTRGCSVCGARFKTEEVLLPQIDKRQKRPKKECPVTKAELKKMMDERPSLKMIANELGVSTTVLNRWLVEFHL